MCPFIKKLSVRLVRSLRSDGRNVLFSFFQWYDNYSPVVLTCSEAGIRRFVSMNISLSLGLTRISGTEKIYIFYPSETDKILGINNTNILTYSNSFKTIVMMIDMWLWILPKNEKLKVVFQWHKQLGRKTQSEYSCIPKRSPRCDYLVTITDALTTTLQEKRGWAKALPLAALHNYTSNLQIRPGRVFWVFGYPGSFFIQVYGILVLQDMGIKYLVFSKFLVWYLTACLRKNRPVILDRKIYFPYILGYSSLNLSNCKNSFCLTENAKYTFLTNFWISGRPAPAP